MTIRNLTPHSVHILDEKGDIIREILQDGELVRLRVLISKVGYKDGILLTCSDFGVPENLPEEKDGVLLIVSQIVKSAMSERRGLVVPAEVVRDSKGKILGCKSLSI